MDWILKNIELVALVALAIGSAIKQLAEAAKTQRTAPTRREEGDEPYEETPPWMPGPAPREFQAPPPREFQTPPSLPQPARIPSFPPEAVVENPDEVLRSQQDLMERLRALKERKAQSRQPAPRAGASARHTAETAPVRLASALRQPASARRAIVLREILGAPVGLR